MSEYPNSCSDCGKCTIGSKECIGCPNFKPYEIALQKTADLVIAAAQRFIELLSKMLPPILDIVRTVAQAYLDTQCKVENELEAFKDRTKLPRPNYKEKPKKYNSPIHRFIHRDRGRR